MTHPEEQVQTFAELISQSQSEKEMDEDEEEGKRKKSRKITVKLQPASKWNIRYLYALNIYFHPLDEPNLVVPQTTLPTDAGIAHTIYTTNM